MTLLYALQSAYLVPRATIHDDTGISVQEVDLKDEMPLGELVARQQCTAIDATFEHMCR